MKVVPTESKIGGVPNYYLIYRGFWERWEETGDLHSKSMAFHYARVAEEMGQASIEDDITLEITIP